MEIVTKDWFMTLLDLKDYIKVKEQALKDYEDRDAWAQKMIVNISKAGFSLLTARLRSTMKIFGN